MRDFDHFRYYGPGPRYSGAWHLIGPLLMLLILGMLLYLTITTFRRTRGFGSVGPGTAAVGRPDEATTVVSPPQSALEIAKMRYARGEITREEFETLRQDLQ